MCLYVCMSVCALQEVFKLKRSTSQMYTYSSSAVFFFFFFFKSGKTWPQKTLRYKPAFHHCPEPLCEDDYLGWKSKPCWLEKALERGEREDDGGRSARLQLQASGLAAALSLFFFHFISQPLWQDVAFVSHTSWPFCCERGIKTRGPDPQRSPL